MFILKRLRVDANYDYQGESCVAMSNNIVDIFKNKIRTL